MRDRSAAGAFFALLLSALLLGCAGGGGPRPGVDPDIPAAPTTERDSTRRGFPTGYAVVRNRSAPTGSAASGYDILHADVDLSVDFQRPKVTARVTYYLVVLRGGLADVRFDARGLAFDSVRVVRSGRTILSDYSTDASGLSVRPRTPLARADTLALTISYTSRDAPAAEAPGFHFADPGGDDPFVPDQVWAGDGRSGARAWLPTWDQPSERMTFTISITVPDTLATVASGHLVEQHSEGPTSRRDIWSLDVPQPASRVGFAAGAFTLIGDVYESPVGKRSSLVFAVDPRLESFADAVFSPVTTMMQVMERRTAVEYPFGEYVQATVWSYPELASGLAGLALLDRSVLRDDRALLDNSGEAVLMHAMASQWFGSWINVRDTAEAPLIEGMNRLFEWTYLSDTGRAVEGEEHIVRTRDRYFEDAAGLRRPVILYESGGSLTAADDHSSAKAALVLSQLGFAIGDEAWWRAIRNFTARGARLPVTLGDLREATEQAARRPLTGYFDQWFLSPGHPELMLNHKYDQDVGIYTLRIRQVQDPATLPVFVLETDVEISFEARPSYRERIMVSSRDTTLRFGVSGRIRYARLDTEGRLLADIRESKPVGQWIAQAEESGAVAGRHSAVKHLSRAASSREIRDALMRVAVEDPSQLVRAEAIRALASYAGSSLVLRFVLDRSGLDAAPECRRAALETLEATADPSALGAFRRALTDSSYQVASKAVEAIARLAPETFWTVVSPLALEPSWNGVLDLSILRALEANPTPGSAPYMRSRMEPHNPERVRLAALAAFSRLASVDRVWKAEVKSTAQVLISDRNIPVRNLARQILRAL